MPQYPSQALPQTPALIVPSRPSSSGLRGTLDPRHPHSINALVVERLGKDEVIAAVRDDGDISSWLVRHVMYAVERRAEVGSSLSPLAEEIKPFFQANVGQSAWGLAIHSEARMIAVSANTHRISIFRFGLARHPAHAEPASSTSRDQDRDCDVTLEIFNGSSNIPHVAFCNTGDDPRGQWLLTTDIAGNCRSMNLLDGEDSLCPALPLDPNTPSRSNQTFRFGPVSSYLESHDRFNAGWAIFFLDKRSFMLSPGVNAALGLGEGGRLPPGQHGNPTVWDISETVSKVPRCAANFSASRRNGRRSRERRSTSTASPSTSSQLAREAASSPDHTTPSESESTMTEGDDDSSDLELDDTMADVDFDDEGTEDTTSFNNMYGGRRIYGNTPRAAYPQRSICNGLPCPILHASVRNVYLLQPPSTLQSSVDRPFSAPTIGFTNALQQFVQGEHAWLNAFERLNMYCYIPAIGVVVLASQKGRALVLALTKLSRATQYPPDAEQSRSEKKSIYAMRIEHILPFEEQEVQLHRPFQPLHGIAASPLQQGTKLLPEDQCRWRLMLMYADHSILSYEISRKGSRDSTIGVGSVLV